MLKHKAKTGEITTTEREEYVRIKIEDEKVAWSEALQTLDGLRKQGIDLEPDMSMEEAAGFANNYLVTFEI